MPSGVGGQRMQELGMADSSLVHITRREYVLECNWKVFADNYLDGGYHVSVTARAALLAAAAAVNCFAQQYLIPSC